MSMQYIRAAYGVPAKRGARVEFLPEIGGAAWRGVIVSAQGHYLRIRRDGDKRTYRALFHPVWGLMYLSDDGAKPEGAMKVEVSIEGAAS